MIEIKDLENEIKELNEKILDLIKELKIDTDSLNHYKGLESQGYMIPMNYHKIIMLQHELSIKENVLKIKKG